MPPKKRDPKLRGLSYRRVGWLRSAMALTQSQFTLVITGSSSDKSRAARLERGESDLERDELESLRAFLEDPCSHPFARCIAGGIPTRSAAGILQWADPTDVPRGIDLLVSGLATAHHLESDTEWVTRLRRSAP